MELFTKAQLLLYFLASLQITYTAFLPPRSYNQNDLETVPPKAEARLSLADSAEWTQYNLQEPEGPGTYSFGYDVEDPETGNVQFRTEERSPNGTVTGSYGYVAIDGTVFMVHYIADHLGYRTKIEQAKLTSHGHRESFLSEDVSPQMKIAIQSLQSKRAAKEDQHSRPIDQKNAYNNNKIISMRKDEIKENNVAYNVQYFPSQINRI